jgi:protein tyrosine phosphatase
MADFNKENEEMQRMQREAIHRVQEMQKRAKRTIEVENNNTNQNRQASATPFRKTKRNNEPVLKQQKNNEKINLTYPSVSQELQDNQNALTDIFDSLMADSEKTMILILILLLSTEEADAGLLLALMYLII